MRPTKKDFNKTMIRTKTAVEETPKKEMTGLVSRERLPADDTTSRKLTNNKTTNNQVKGLLSLTLLEIFTSPQDTAHVKK